MRYRTLPANRARPGDDVLLQDGAGGRAVDGDPRLGLLAFAQLGDLRIGEAPQAQALFGGADQLLASGYALTADRDQIILLAGEQVRTVEDEQRLTGLHRLPGLSDEQLLDICVVLEDDVGHLRLVHRKPHATCARTR
jgi:hypothetical protein